MKDEGLINMRRLCSRALIFAACLLPVAFAGAVRAQQTVDQILVLVNEDIITRSDLLWSIALDPKAPSPAGNISPDILRQKLDVMIDERLIALEAGRVPATDISQDEINRKRTELISRFKSEAEFRQRVESVGLTPARIDELLRQRVLIERFIDFRFRSFIFVTEPEIERYYNEQLAPEIRKAGQVPPPVAQVHDGISERLKQEKINQEIDRWLTTARQRADIVQLAEP